MTNEPLYSGFIRCTEVMVACIRDIFEHSSLTSDPCLPSPGGRTAHCSTSAIRLAKPPGDRDASSAAFRPLDAASSERLKSYRPAVHPIFRPLDGTGDTRLKLHCPAVLAILLFPSARCHQLRAPGVILSRSTTRNASDILFTRWH